MTNSDCCTRAVHIYAAYKAGCGGVCGHRNDLLKGDTTFLLYRFEFYESCARLAGGTARITQFLPKGRVVCTAYR